MSRFARSLRICFGLVIVLTSARADSYHGIRNSKCGDDEEGAKSLVFDQLKNAEKLCPNGGTAGQAGGWSCHHGGDCPKTKFRCNTQYTCAKNSGLIPTDTISPTPTMFPSPRPSFRPAIAITPTPTPRPLVTATPTPAMTVDPAAPPSAMPATTPTNPPAVHPNPAATGAVVVPAPPAGAQPNVRPAP